jgi:hypothetical protein
MLTTIKLLIYADQGFKCAIRLFTLANNTVMSKQTQKLNKKQHMKKNFKHKIGIIIC